MATSTYTQAQLTEEARHALSMCPENQRHGEHLKHRKGTVTAIKWDITFGNHLAYAVLRVRGFCKLCNAEVRTNVAI